MRSGFTATAQHMGLWGKSNFKFVIVVQAIKEILLPPWELCLLEKDMLQTFNPYFKPVILLIVLHPQAL